MIYCLETVLLLNRAGWAILPDSGVRPSAPYPAANASGSNWRRTLKKGQRHCHIRAHHRSHLSDIQKLLKLFDLIVSRGNTLVVIAHNLDVVKQSDWIIDIGPDSRAEI